MFVGNLVEVRGGVYGCGRKGGRREGGKVGRKERGKESICYCFLFILVFRCEIFGVFVLISCVVRYYSRF